MTAPQRPDRMPVLVVSGFLGAGKTTFLNRLLATPPLAGSMVIVNEFGETGLDGLFLAEAADAQGRGLMIEELTSGCLCCTLQGPLVSTLEDLLRARDNGRIAPFGQLVIETTGLADPAPILGAFARHPYLSLRYLVGGIVTVVDAAADLSTFDATPEATAQIAVADVLALSKTDLEGAHDTAQLVGALRQRNPHAAIGTTDALAADPSWLDALLAQAAPPVAPDDDHHSHHGHHDHGHHHHGDHHGHDHTHAHSLVLETDAPLESRRLAMLLDLLGMNMPGDLLRVKGIAWVKDGTGAQPWAVHMAGPLQHPARPIDARIASRLDRDVTRIVVITRTDRSDQARALFAACLKG